MNVTDLVPSKDDSGRTAYFTRLEPKASSLREIHRDLNLRHVLLELFVQVDEAIDPCKRLPHTCRLLTQHAHLRAEDANDDRLA